MRNIMVYEMTFAMKILQCFALGIIMRSIMVCEMTFAIKILHCFTLGIIIMTWFVR